MHADIILEHFLKTKATWNGGNLIEKREKMVILVIELSLTDNLSRVSTWSFKICMIWIIYPSQDISWIILTLWYFSWLTSKLFRSRFTFLSFFFFLSLSQTFLATVRTLYSNKHRSSNMAALLVTSPRRTSVVCISAI